MVAFVAIALLGIIPHTDVVTDEVDLIELNRFFDGNGRRVFDQIIFYDWNGRPGLHQVRAWRMYKTSAQMPRFNEKTGEFVSVWRDTQGGDCMRRVTSKSFRKTFTQYDPELEARKNLATEFRRELTKPRRNFHE